MGKSNQDARQSPQGTFTATSGDPAGETPNQPQNVSNPPQSAPGTPTVSEEDKARIQRMASAAGARRSGLYKLPNGDIRMDVTIPVEIAAIVESQAECAGEDLEQFIQRNVTEALMAYVCASAT